ncbi:MAG: hypothetical protein QXX94_06225 [Candidatus Bathyarchaeia archaeon]
MLDVSEVIQFNEIFNWYDNYNVDFEVGVPVGATASAALGNLPAIALQIICGICVSISYINSAEPFIGDHLENRGRRPVGGYDVPETIYVRVSKLNYTTLTGYIFKVPMGIYFTCV